MNGGKMKQKNISRIIVISIILTVLIFSTSLQVVKIASAQGSTKTENILTINSSYRNQSRVSLQIPRKNEIGLNRSVAQPVITSIAAGGMYTCALTSDGAVKCWGENGSGELGDGTTTNRSTPGDVIGLSSEVIAVSAGMYHTCVITSSGGVKCWGNNGFGELGDGTTTNSSSPVDVIDLSSGVIAISTGGNHTCALTSGGAVKCWGYNYAGELGDGTTTNSSSPVDVKDLSSGIIAVAASGAHSCALTSTGAVKCWGHNSSGQLGDTTTFDRYTPVNVEGLSSGVTAISAGSHSTCALTSGGGVKCWGENTHGQLGDGTIFYRYSPVEVLNLTSVVTAISEGYEHTCVLTANGGIKCWGYNQYGQLGDGGIIESHTPVDTVGLSDGMEAISAGGNHACALAIGGAVKCWGYNGLGQLGDGTTIDRSTPVDVVWLTPPSLLTPTDNSYTKNSTPTFTWNDSTGADGYLFEIDDNSDFSSPVYLSPILTPTTTALASALEQKAYYWRVSACIGSICGKWSAYRKVTITYPVPVLSFISPENKWAGRPGVTLIVFGTKFTPSSIVRWNGSDRVTTFVTPGKLTAGITAADLATASVAAVTVFNPTPGGGTSVSKNFTVKNDVPVITGLSPASKIMGKPGFTLNVYGNKFGTGAKVRWNGSDRPTTFVNMYLLTATISASDISSGGLASVTVFNPTPGGGLSNVKTFTINNDVPVITGLSPASKIHGRPGFTLTVYGKKFSTGAKVRWNGSDRPTTFVNMYLLTATISAADIASAGTANVKVFNPTPFGGLSNAITFTIQ
jgi:alpha-tubulin suppressor-like RCC1 family protein